MELMQCLFQSSRKENLFPLVIMIYLILTKAPLQVMLIYQHWRVMLVR